MKRILCWIGIHKWKWDEVCLGDCDPFTAIALTRASIITKGYYRDGKWYEIERTVCERCNRRWLKSSSPATPTNAG